MDHVFDEIQKLAQNLLLKSDIMQPPVNPFLICQKLKIEVIYDSRMPNRARTKQLDGRHVIILKPDPRRERLNWAIAHELGEIVYGQTYCGQFNEDSQLSATGIVRETWANWFASALLLPEEWFRSHAQLTRYSLLELKQIFGTASHELIAERISHLLPGSMITILDQGQIKKRTGNIRQIPRMLSPEENKLWHAVHYTGTSQEVETPQVSIRGWPIHEPHWKREFLLTVSRADSDEQYD